MTLKTIDEHNATRRLELARANATGIACRVCGGELMWNSTAVLLTYPPKRKVVCEDCGYETMVLA